MLDIVRSLSLAAGLLSLTSALPHASPSFLSSIANTSALLRRADSAAQGLGPRSVAYVQTFHTTDNGDLSLAPISSQHSGLTHIILAALHVNANPGDITLNDNNPNDTYWDNMWSQAADLQKDGIKVMMMLGGAARGSYPRLCSGDPNGEDDTIVVNDDYYLPLLQTLRYHKIEGLDLDIEERVDISCPTALLARLNTDFGPEFLLTMAPVATDLGPQARGLGGFKYAPLDASLNDTAKPNGKVVDWYNVQFYNGWGNAASPAGYNAIVQQGWASDRVVLGVLDSPNDGGSGWYNISTYTATVQALRANYGGQFGGVVGWEYYDAGYGDETGASTDQYGDETAGNGTYQNDPWTWERQVNSLVEAGPGSGGGSGGQNWTNWPIPYGASPWPGSTKSLQELLSLLKGASNEDAWTDAVWALNTTMGSWPAALAALGL